MSKHRRRKVPLGLWLMLPGLAFGVVMAAVTAHASEDGGPHNHSDHPGLHQLTASPDCTLTVPANPLSAQGLATPYVLNSAGKTCSESDENTAAFVQATILNTETGQVTVYNPAVINPGDHAAPPVPKLPAGRVVTIWTGFNANVLKLTGPGAGHFVNFAQQSYANSPEFFTVLNREIGIHRTVVPPLGTGTDGKTCPSSRDWSVVDQDQSDNVPVTYGAPYGTSNGSDEALLQYIDAALGCKTWQAPDAVTGVSEPDGALQEAQAAADQAQPQALVPSLDPFVLSGGQPDLALQNLYRRQVDQPPSAGNDTAAYCGNLQALGVPRLLADAPLETGAAPPFAQIAPTLAGVLKLRFEATWGMLACGGPAPY